MLLNMQFSTQGLRIPELQLRIFYTITWKSNFFRGHLFDFEKKILECTSIEHNNLFFKILIPHCPAYGNEKSIFPEKDFNFKFS